MKLVDILAYKLIDWPRSVVAFVQGYNGCIYPAGGGMEVYLMKSELAEDWELTEVTHKEWLAAVEAKNGAPQNDESQNVALIDWSKAPDGWRLVPIRPTKEMRAAAGREASKYNASRQTFFAGDAWAPMVDNAPAYVAGEWDGEGLPPVGATCEYDARPVGKGDSLWVTVKINYLSEWTIVFECVAVPEGVRQENIGVELSVDVGVSTPNEFRPIRMPEQIAADEREKARDEVLNLVAQNAGLENEELWQLRLKIVGEMLDMGYRKP